MSRLRLLCCAILAVWSGVASAAPLNGGFDDDGASCLLSSWTVTGDGISGDAIFPNSSPCDAAFAFSSFLGGTPGVLSQDIAITPGLDYTLSFELLDDSGGIAINTFLVTFGGFSTTITGDQAPGYTLFTLPISGSSITDPLTTLSFEGDNISAWHLDDVALASASPPGVPEPASVLIFGMGLLLLSSISFHYRCRESDWLRRLPSS